MSEEKKQTILKFNKQELIEARIGIWDDCQERFTGRQSPAFVLTALELLVQDLKNSLGYENVRIYDVAEDNRH